MAQQENKKITITKENGCIFGCLGLLLLFVIIQAIVWLSFGVLLSVDWLVGARLTPGTPAIMWAIWGAILGGTLAFWLVAPIYGLRKMRPLIVAAPLLLMGAIALLANGF